MQKSILMINGYSYPEKIAFSGMELDLYRTLAESNIVVDVITPTPTRGISYKEYLRYKDIAEETLENGMIRIHRFKLFKESKNIVLRGFRYILGNIISLYKAGQYKSADVIFSNSTPPTQGIVCALLKRKLKIPFIYYLCDVFPDSLINAGIAKKSSLVFKVCKLIEQKTYSVADEIVVVSDDIKENLMKKGISEQKITVIHNWINTEKLKYIPREKNKLFEEFDLKRDKFYLLYAGNIGSAQGIDFLLEMANRLKDELEIYFIIIGSGNDEDRVYKMLDDLKLSNVKIFPMQGRERISEVYSLGDISFVTCKPGFGNSGMPSKTWSIMSVARPILLVFDKDTELYKIIVDNECGFFSPSGDINKLEDLIRDIYKNKKELLEKYGQNGRRYAVENMSHKVCTEKFLHVFYKYLI